MLKYIFTFVLAVLSVLLIQHFMRLDMKIEPGFTLDAPSQEVKARPVSVSAPEVKLPEQAYYWVNCDILNLRDQPSTEAKILSKLRRYDNIVVLKPHPAQEWLEVQTLDGKKGYVFQQFIKAGYAENQGGKFVIRRKEVAGLQ